MSFLYPQLLWLILGLFALAAVLFLMDKKSINHYFSQEIYEKLVQNRSGLSKRGRLFLLIIAMSLMIVALARPVSDEQNIKINETAIDLIVALDISRSMEAEDLYPNRLLWGKKKLLDLIDKAEGIRVGVMAFAANAYVVSPITSDQEVARYLVENLQSNSISEKGTDILQLVDAAAKQLKGKVHKYLLLITDGGDEKDYGDAITLAKEEHITLFVLATASAKGAPIREKEGGFVKKDGHIILTRLNEAIKSLAFKTGGVYIQSATSSDDIDGMLGEIRKIAQDETIASSVIKKYHEYFSYFLWAALVFLLLAFASLPKKNLAMMLVLALFGLPESAKAGLTDFMTIHEANKAYEAKQYDKSQRSYEALTQSQPSSEVHYNLGNTLYKQKKYKESIEAFDKVDKDSALKQKALYNSANAYAMNKELEKAKEAYEAALERGEDKQTRENLEEVLKHIKEQEKQKKESNKDQDKASRDQDKKEKDDQQSQDKDKQKQKNSQKDDDQKEAKGSKQKPEQGDVKEQQEAQNEAKKDQKSQEKAKQKADQRDDAKKQSEKVDKQAQASQKDITDKEERKLLDQLNTQKGMSYRYYVPTEHKKEQHDKPW